MESAESVSKQERMQEATSCSQQSTLSLSERRAFIKLPLAERRQILAKQAEEMLEHYQNSQKWRELEAGDIIDY